MGDNEAVGEIVEPEVEDLKSDAWTHLNHPSVISSGMWRYFPKKWIYDHMVDHTKSLHENPWLCTTNLH